MSDMEKIREKIQEITQRQLSKKYIDKKDNTYDEYYDVVKELTKYFHEEEISIHDYMYHCKYEHNCYAYALGLRNSDKYLEMCRKEAEKHSEHGARSDFISYLIEKKYLKEIINSTENCLVIYFDDKNNPQHAGILQKDEDGNDKIISKWGNLKFIRTYKDKGIDFKEGEIPIIFAHKLWYVPTDYGTREKYYEPLIKEESEKYFREFLINIKGISLGENSN